MSYPDGYIRVSTVCDAISRIESESLSYVGGTWAADRAIAVAKEVFDGSWQDYSKFLELYPGSTERDFLTSKWFYNDIRGGVTQTQQAAADRGTVTNLVWDFFWENPSASDMEVHEFMEETFESQRQQAKAAYAEYIQFVELGLVDAKDKKAKPERAYQCDFDEAWQYVCVMLSWLRNQAQYVQLASQFYLQDDDENVCGTCDSVGLWQGMNVVLDLKTSTSDQPKRGHRAQLAKYADMLNKNGAKIESAVVLIVTPEKVVPRMMTTEGFHAGRIDFSMALAILLNGSMRGSFATTKQTQETK